MRRIAGKQLIVGGYLHVRLFETVRLGRDEPGAAGDCLAGPVRQSALFDGRDLTPLGGSEAEGDVGCVVVHDGGELVAVETPAGDRSGDGDRCHVAEP